MRDYFLHVVMMLVVLLTPAALNAGEAIPNATEPPLNAAEAGSADPLVSEARREALLLLQRAELELEKGARNSALELAKKAQALYPEARSIKALLRQLLADRRVRTAVSSQLRAKARMAAALTRASRLIKQRRYAEAANLLDGVRDAVDLFPEGTRVRLFRQQAERYADSARYALEVRSLVGEDAETVLPEDKSALGKSATASRPRPIAPPRNAKRLAPVAGRVPTWYTQLKASLAVPMNVEYPGMPLGLVLEEIQKATGVPIVVDEPVRKAGIPIGALIDLRINEVSAETVLALATEISGTEYVLMHDQIVITTRDKAIDYLSELPKVLADRWLASRVLFPELFEEEFARQKSVSPRDRETEAVELRPYLRSGEALLAEVERLLR